MAKYADYVKRQDNVDKELEEVENKKQARATTKEIPESVLKRFDGKSVEDVMEAYANLEKLNSRQGDDLGKLRKTVDQLLELQSQTAVTSPDKSPDGQDSGISTDDLYDNPEEAIGKVVEKKSKQTSERIEALEAEVKKSDLEKRKQDLDKEFEGWESEIQTPEFVDWVKASRARTRLAVAADQWDIDAAHDLLELWYDRKESKEEARKEQERERQFKDATLETSGPSSVDVVETYSRSDLMEKRIAAKHGNRIAERWLQAHARSIAAAYEEGRITD